MNIGFLIIIFYFMTGSGINIDLIVFQDEFIVLPFGKVLETITTHNDREFVLRIFFLEISKGVYGERRFWKSELDIGGSQATFIFNRQINKKKTMVFIQ